MRNSKLSNIQKNFSLLFIFLTIFALIFVTLESTHEAHCSDHCCPICLIIHLVKSNLEILSLLISVFAIFHLNSKHSKKIFYKNSSFNHLTNLYSLKIRIND